MRFIVGCMVLAALANGARAELSLVPAVLTADAGPMVEAREYPYSARLTLYWENDNNFVKPFDQHDRHYTAGVGAALALRSPGIDRVVRQMPSFWEEFARGDYAVGLVGALTMYTPENITAREPIGCDRPFAGYTYAGLFVQRARRVAGPEFGFPKVSALWDAGSYSAFEAVEVDVGILGPSSLAQNAQELIHHAFDYPYPRGWRNQVHDEPQLTLKYDRHWRSLAIRPDEKVPLALQVIPDMGLTAGTLMDEVHAGVMVRFGYRLPDDAGPGELAHPADFTYEAPCTCPGIFDNPLKAAYAFVRPYGKLVAHNALVEGDNFRHDDVVTQTIAPAVGGLQFGFAVQFLKHFEIAWSTTYQSREFAGQRGWDSWSSLSTSFSVAW